MDNTKDDTTSSHEKGIEMNKKRKRGLKPRSKRNRKRARGGIGIHNIYDTERDVDGEDDSSQYQVQIDIMPLDIHYNDKKSYERKGEKRIRVVRPYPYTHATFAKARWIDRTLLDVYTTEFGSYPKSYYEAAIRNGRITVSGRKVDCEYKIKGGDELCHVVHRHEPAVAISDEHNFHNNNETKKYVTIIHEDEEIIVVDKPSTVPVHPCGSYNLNSLFHILVDQNPSLKGSLYNIHRLDRLTSGLVIIAKNTEMAKVLGKCINDRDGCHKLYLARVKGRFPLNAPSDQQHNFHHHVTDNFMSKQNLTSIPNIINGEWAIDHEQEKNGDPATAFWITDENNKMKNTTLLDVFNARIDISKLAHVGLSSDQENDYYIGKWLHLACPCEIVCHKNGVCKAGNGKPAQTAFSVVRYDDQTDTTVVIAKPLTGRTHQIRLHLQYLGHPIANDPNYGGDIFFANEEGSMLCKDAKKRMEHLDSSSMDTDLNCVSRPSHALTTDIPATEEEVQFANKYERKDFDSFLDYLKKSCVWCGRSKGEEDRSVLEFLSRSQGIWLHALQYSLKGPNGRLSYSTRLPKWSCFHNDKLIQSDN